MATLPFIAQKARSGVEFRENHKILLKFIVFAPHAEPSQIIKETTGYTHFWEASIFAKKAIFMKSSSISSKIGIARKIGFHIKTWKLTENVEIHGFAILGPSKPSIFPREYWWFRGCGGGFRISWKLHGISWKWWIFMKFHEKVEKSRKGGISENAENGERCPRGPPPGPHPYLRHYGDLIMCFRIYSKYHYVRSLLGIMMIRALNEGFHDSQKWV